MGKIERNAALSKEKTAAMAKKKEQRKEQRAALKARTLKYDKEYSDYQKKLVTMRREAKASGNFFMEPDSKLLFVIRIVGIIKLSPKPRKVLQLLRLKQLHNGVFLKVNKPILNMLKLINPYVTYGYPSLKTVRELIYKRGFAKINKQRIPLSENESLSKAMDQAFTPFGKNKVGETPEHNIHGVEDLIHEIYTVGPHFKQASNILWPFKLSSPKGGFKCKRHGFGEIQGGDWGNREDLINELIARMN